MDVGVMAEDGDMEDVKDMVGVALLENIGVKVGVGLEDNDGEFEGVAEDEVVVGEKVDDAEEDTDGVIEDDMEGLGMRAVGELVVVEEELAVGEPDNVELPEGLELGEMKGVGGEKLGDKVKLWLELGEAERSGENVGVGVGIGKQSPV